MLEEPAVRAFAGLLKPYPKIVRETAYAARQLELAILPGLKPLVRAALSA